jgi:hypothetical protein
MELTLPGETHIKRLPRHPAVAYLFLVRPQSVHASVILANAGVPMLMLAFPAAFFLLIPVIGVESWIARGVSGISASRKFVGVVTANAISTLAGWPLMWMALAALQINLIPHGLSWPDSPIRQIASVTLEAAWLIPYSHDDMYWKVPTAAMVLMVPAFFVSVFLEQWTLRFLWRSDPSSERKRFVWRANLFSYALLIASGFVWLAYSITYHHYHPEL